MPQNEPTLEGDGSIERLAEKLMPGWTAVKKVRSSNVLGGLAAKDSLEEAGVKIMTMPSLDKLKAKYAGIGGKDQKLMPDSFADDSDTAIVNLQNGPLNKTVAISRSERKVVWSQG